MNRFLLSITFEKLTPFSASSSSSFLPFISCKHQKSVTQVAQLRNEEVTRLELDRIRLKRPSTSSLEKGLFSLLHSLLRYGERAQQKSVIPVLPLFHPPASGEWEKGWEWEGGKISVGRIEFAIFIRCNKESFVKISRERITLIRGTPWFAKVARDSRS